MRINTLISSRLSIFFLFFSPYITFGFFESDISPGYLTVILITCLLLSKYSRIGLAKTGVLSGLIVLWSVLFSNDIRLIKFAASVVLAESLFRLGGVILNEKFGKNLFYVAVAWVLVGLATIADPQIFQALFYRVGFTESRGATGLCPEPAYYGVGSAFMFAIAMEASKTYRLLGDRFGATIREGRTIKTLLNTSALIFSLSVFFSASLYGIIIFSLFLLFYRPGVFAIYIAVALLGLCSLEFESGLRIFILIENVLSNGIITLLDDYSISYRLANIEAIFLSLKGLRVDEADALGSGITILFINQGIFGVLFLIALFWSSGWRRAFFSLVKSPAMCAIMGSVFIIGPFSNIYFWIYLGVYSYSSSCSNKSREAFRVLNEKSCNRLCDVTSGKDFPAGR